MLLTRKKRWKKHKIGCISHFNLSMESKAVARFVRYSPKKVEQVLDLIRNKSVQEALTILSFAVKSSTEVVEKTLKSALANMGKSAQPGDVYIKEAIVGKGFFFKRFRAGPHGRAMPYRRKTCHITIVLSDNKGNK